MTIKNQEALKERANNLGTFNGLRLVLVSLEPAADPTRAILTLQFFNDNEVAAIFTDIQADPKQARIIFPLSGGHRLIAGPLDDQVNVVEVADDGDASVLHLTVEPIGDYSTYTLSVVYPNMDPLFSEVEFKFRPGCFNNCPPEWEAPPKPKPDPAIDYLAKDYDTFRHTLVAWMMQRVPYWEATSEADLDQVLLELFSAAADELSDYQDRVMNEAYLATARKRVSLARHARLMDYHIHQGNQASTWLAVEVNAHHKLAKGFEVWSSGEPEDPQTVIFVTRQAQTVDPLLNGMGLYTWSGAIPALAAGTTTADLKVAGGSYPEAKAVEGLIRGGKVTHLVIQEHLNPRTGEERGWDPGRRQLLKLLPGDQGAEARLDPVTKEWFVRVSWEDKDALRSNYCFTVDKCPDKADPVTDVSLFHGNLAPVCHGRPQTVTFLDPEMPLTKDNQFHYEIPPKEAKQFQSQGVICRLPDGPLAYRDTEPGGEIPPVSTLEVSVEVDGGSDPREEVSSLVHSDDSDERGDHFVVETDELGRSLIRFGNGINGKKLPDRALVHCSYQVGRGLDGNIGADRLIAFFNGKKHPEVARCWNPFDVTNGRDPEPVDAIIRRVPEAYRFRQLRAITLHDYINRAEELPEVSRAAARYAWTGSWRTVRITIDPAGTSNLTPGVRDKVRRHLETVRLIGEDLEIRAPRFVPLDIVVWLCVHPDYWPQDIRFLLEQEFSEGYTRDGRQAFFHPDLWTFGQELHVSQIIGRVQAVQGVDRVIQMALKRWHEATPGTPQDKVSLQAQEIIQVKNDPDHLERGFIRFEMQGGRQ